MNTITNKPLADKHLTSYRYAGPYGWIMIGAKDNENALNEAARSTEGQVKIEYLQIWDGNDYVPLICQTCTLAIIARSKTTKKD